jgi:hypothetical protein
VPPGARSSGALPEPPAVPEPIATEAPPSEGAAGGGRGASGLASPAGVAPDRGGASAADSLLWIGPPVVPGVSAPPSSRRIGPEWLSVTAAVGLSSTVAAVSSSASVPAAPAARASAWAARDIVSVVSSDPDRRWRAISDRSVAISSLAAPAPGSTGAGLGSAILSSPLGVAASGAPLSGDGGEAPGVVPLVRLHGPLPSYFFRWPAAWSLIFSWSWMIPWSRASGRGGQPAR